MMGLTKKVLLSAFGIHKGGGLVLLNALIKGLSGSLKAVALDLRFAFDASLIPSNVRVEYVRRSFAARMLALRRLGRSAMNTHKGKLGQESQTKGFEAGGWTQGVPRFFSVETVWAHAALETIRRIAPHQVATFNFARLIAVCRVLHSEYASEIDQASVEVEHIVGSTATMLHDQIRVEMKRYRHERLIRFVKRLARPTAAGGRAYVSGLDTIVTAPEALAQHMARLGLRWEQTADSLAATPEQLSR